MLECSEGVRFRLVKIGLDYASIRHLAISHSHPDHYALPQFLQSIWNKGQWSDLKAIDHSLNVYGPKALVNDYPKLWNLFRPQENFPPLPRLNFFPMTENKVVEISGAKLSAAKVFHGGGKMDAVAFRLELPNGFVIVYSGDTGECQGIRQISKNADIFICEASAKIGDDGSPVKIGHLNPYLVGDIAKNSGVKKLILFHYTGLDSDEELAAECQRAGFQNEIVIGKDFQVFKF